MADNKHNGLTSKAMLVDLDISVVGTSKKDDSVTASTQSANNATVESGYYLKRIIDKKYTKFNQIASRARDYHRKITFAWGDNGERLLPSKLYFDYTQQMADFKAQFESEASTFISIYPQILAEMPKILGAMHDPNDYIDQADLINHFKFETKIRPVPDADDFRVDISNAEIEKIKQQIAEESDKLQQAAMEELWKRLYSPVKKLSEKLTDPTAKKYHKSLIGNIVDITDILPKLNIGNDQALNTLSADIVSRLCSEDIGEIKKNPIVRKDLADAAGDILNQIESRIGIAN